jgi:hypothetical protein
VNAPTRAANAIRRAFAFAERERKYVLDELTQVKGLMPLLMKRRNRSQWTPDDRVELRATLKRLSGLSWYLAVLLLPGGFFALPAVAWWLDRRRERRAASAPS